MSETWSFIIKNCSYNSKISKHPKYKPSFGVREYKNYCLASPKECRFNFDSQNDSFLTQYFIRKQTLISFSVGGVLNIAPRCSCVT